MIEGIRRLGRAVVGWLNPPAKPADGRTPESFDPAVEMGRQNIKRLDRLNERLGDNTVSAAVRGARRRPGTRGGGK